MRRGVAAAVLSLVLVAHPAAGWWDEEECCDESWWDGPAYEEPAWEGPVWEPEPVGDPGPVREPEPPASRDPYEPPVEEPARYEPPIPEPVAYERPEPEPVREADGRERPEPERPIDRWAVAAEEGLHHVDTVAISNERTTSGLRTTFTTTTERADTEAAARLIAPLAPGETSGYDDVIWNGRMRRTDGRLVGGYLYENFVWDGERWVHDKYVLFQDDSETGSLPVAPPIETPPAATDAPPRIPVASPEGAAPPATDRPAAPRSDPPAPEPRDRTEPPASAAPIAGPPAASASPRAVRAGIALAPQGDTLGRIEVMRGRSVRLWTRAFVDGASGSVTAWQLRSGEVTALGPLAGRGDDPLIAMWDEVSPPGDAFVVIFDVTVSVPAEGARTVPAAITVVVRSPAIVE